MASYNELRKKMNAAAASEDSYVSEPDNKAVETKAEASNNVATEQPAAPANTNQYVGQKDSVVAFALYTKLCSVVCTLDKDVLLHNQALIEKPMFEDDRYVPLESLIFIAKHAAEMMAMLTLDYKGFRDLCGDALEAEIMTDSMTAEQKLEYRSKTMDEHLIEPRDTFKMGLSVPDANTYATLIEYAKTDIDAVTSNKKLMDTMDAKSRVTTDDQRMICSIILSNHIYMLRVFSKNAIFLNQVSDMINSFRAEYGIR